MSVTLLEYPATCSAAPHREPWRVGALLALVTVGSLLSRLWRLDTAPPTLNTDEIVALRLVARILGGQGPGPLALDANGQPALSGYLQALSMHLCGDTVWALRLPAALLGTLAVPLFYLVARQIARPWPALGATVLFCSSVYSLSLGRSGWINDYMLSAELVAIWTSLVGMRRPHLALICASGLTCALAGYGYAPFRLLPLGMLPFLLTEGTGVSKSRPRRALTWLGAYLAGSLPLWLSLATQHTVLAQYVAAHAINSQLLEYAPGTPWLQILATQTWKFVVGLVLLIPGTVSGLDLQHVPAGTWLLDGASTLCYWLGLWSMADRSRTTASYPDRVSGTLWWWLLVVPLGLAEIPVRDCPSLHPAVAAFPLYLFISARGLTYAAARLGRYRMALVLLILWSTLSSLRTYAVWVDSGAATQARHLVDAPTCIPTSHPLTQPCRATSAATRSMP
jgi:4-amino-4-deoxy-L-arabinose transferase-like glycosyltransferase